MTLRTDQEYFRDIDAAGRLREEQEDGSVGQAFSAAIEEERQRDVELGANIYHKYTDTSKIVQMQMEKSLHQKIVELEKEVFANCWAKLEERENKDVIGAFPQRIYHMYTLTSQKYGTTYPVIINCAEQIAAYEVPWIRQTGDQMAQIRELMAKRRKLLTAAVLSVVHLLVNLLTALSFLPGNAQLYWPGALGWGLQWSVAAAAVLLLAGQFHKPETKNPLLGGIAVVATFLFQFWGPSLQGTEQMLAVAAAMALSVIFCWRYIRDAVRSWKIGGAVETFVRRVQTQVEHAHRGLRLLALWYRDMTGQTAEGLENQEKTLRESISFAGKCTKRFRIQ